MRTLVITVWFLVPLAVVAYHYGPGQKHVVVDKVGQLLKLAKAHAAAGVDQKEKAQQYREDLEAVIRLARMDLDELQGLALPCQCKRCCSSKCKKKGDCKCKGKKKGKRQGKKKKKDARGVSSGPPPDGSGS